jgi:hypothetical protein
MIQLNHADKKMKRFMYQNLQKSKCYNTDFSGSNFDYACFRGAHMKSCLFNACTFIGAEFVGSNLKDSQFKEAQFEYTLFDGVKLEGVDFRGAKFVNSYFVASDVDKALNLNLSDEGVNVFTEMPVIELSETLMTAFEMLMSNPFVKKSRVLDTKDKKLNTISVLILLKLFSEEILIRAFDEIQSQLDRDFYTLSYLIKRIEKIAN